MQVIARKDGDLIERKNFEGEIITVIRIHS